jgi:hypothetical protein
MLKPLVLLQGIARHVESRKIWRRIRWCSRQQQIACLVIERWNGYGLSAFPSRSLIPPSLMWRPQELYWVGGLLQEGHCEAFLQPPWHPTGVALIFWQYQVEPVKQNSPLVRANAYEKSTWKNITPCSSPTILGWKKQYSLALSLMYLSTVVLENQKLHHVPHIQPPLNAPEHWSAVKGTGPTIRYA